MNIAELDEGTVAPEQSALTGQAEDVKDATRAASDAVTQALVANVQRLFTNGDVQELERLFLENQVEQRKAVGKAHQLEVLGVRAQVIEHALERLGAGKIVSDKTGDKTKENRHETEIRKDTLVARTEAAEVEAQDNVTTIRKADTQPAATNHEIEARQVA